MSIFKTENLKKFWTNLEVKYGKDRILVAIAVLVVIVLTLWIAQSPPPENKSNSDEIGLVIPKGQVVIPLELGNANALNGLVTRTAIVNLFKPGEKEPLVEALRIIKLSAGEGPLFGALVPENLAGKLQDIFSNPKLRAAICAQEVGPSRFHINNKSKPSFLEISVGD